MKRKVNSMNITSKLVKELWSEALLYHNAKSAGKNDSVMMKAVGSFLDLIGVLDKDKFMNRFTTTILDTIYCPFEVGVESGNYTLQKQVMVLVHELTHVKQFHNGSIKFLFDYIVDRSTRAEYEAEAYAADLEIYYWMNGKLYDIYKRASILKHYGLAQDHIDYAASYMLAISEVVKQGGTVSPIAAWTMTFLEKRGVVGAKGQPQY